MKVNTATAHRVRKDGSIGIPKKVRNALNIRGGDLVILKIKNNELIVSFTKPTCPCCGKDLVHQVGFGPFNICESCAGKIEKAVRNGKAFNAAFASVSAKSSLWE